MVDVANLLNTLPAIPTSLVFGDNLVRLAEAPGPDSTNFIFEFAINPEERIDFKGEQAIAEVDIPGAEGSILQPVGSKPLRISWHGIFEDVFDGRGLLVRRAVDDVLTLEGMRISGKTWVFKYLDISHFVKIKSFNYTPVSPRGNLDRFEYDIDLTKFYPNLGFQRPQSVTIFVQRKEQQNALQGIKNFFDGLNNAIALVDSTVVTVSSIVLAPLTTFDDTTDTIFDQLTTTGNLVNDVVANAALNITTPQRELQSIQQRIDFVGNQLQTISGNAAVITNSPHEFMIALRDLDNQLKFLKQLPVLKPAPPVIYTVIDGDRIEDVAAQFYGDFEAWRPIASANNLADPSILVPGQQLTIPQ